MTVCLLTEVCQVLQMLARLRTNYCSFSDNKSGTSKAAKPSLSVSTNSWNRWPRLAPLVAVSEKKRGD
jgi:hypothetical protein